MRIDGLNLDLRERNAWEAFDLGVALARTTGWKLFLPYSMVFILLALLVHVVVIGLGGPFWLALFVLWWVKPAADRVALAVLAQAVFGAAPDWRTTMRSLRGIPRSGWLMSFTFGRFDFARSFHLPVRQLEGQTGKAGARTHPRARQEAARPRGVADHRGVALCIRADLWRQRADRPARARRRACGHGLVVPLRARRRNPAEPDTVFVPAGAGRMSARADLHRRRLRALPEPAHRAGRLGPGSGLQAHEHTHRRAAARRARAGEQRGEKRCWRLLAGARPGLVLAFGGAPQTAQAQAAPQGQAEPEAAKDSGKSDARGGAQDDDDDDEDKPVAVPPPAAAPAGAAATPAAAASAEKKAIRDVLASPEFEEYGKEKTWSYRGKPDTPDGKPFRLGDGWIQFARFVGEFLRGAIWVLAILGLAWLLMLLSRHFGWFKGALNFKRAKPDVLFGMDLRPESLPDDVPGAARALLAAGNSRGALALLYRASLSYMIHERDIEVRLGDTEGDCVRRVETAGPAALAAYFRDLVDAWGRIAYAGRPPAPAEINGLIGAWAKHFVRPQTEQAPGTDAAQRPALGTGA